MTGPSELLALMSAVSTGEGGGTARLITTESLEVLTPSVQSKVRVTGLPIAGYQGCPGGIGPPLPAREIPDGPEGEVRVQAVESVELQEYE